jgi:hypothetical protein
MIYVLVPARNEASTVGLLLWKVRQVFTAFPREYQLLVADDASTDDTNEVLAPYARALPLTLVTHRERRGYAASVEELLRLAASRTDRPRRDLAVVLQGDFSDSPDDIPELVRHIESGADLALADYRRRPGLPRLEAWARRFLGLVAAPPAPLDRTPDFVASLKAMRLVTLARALSQRPSGHPLLTSEGWAADAELLLALARQSRRVDVVPVASAASARRPTSRVRALRSAWAAWRALRRPRPVDGTRPPAAAAKVPAGRPGRRRTRRSPESVTSA